MSQARITPMMISAEMQRMLSEWLAGKPFAHEFSVGAYNVITDSVPFMLRVVSQFVELHETIVRHIPQRDFELSLIEFATKHLLPMVELVPVKQVNQATKKFIENFANAPVSLGEIRSSKANDGKLRSVRDLLVETLRKIDAGDPDYTNVTAGVLVMKRRDEKGDSYTRWDAGGSEYDYINAMGMLMRVIINMEID